MADPIDKNEKLLDDTIKKLDLRISVLISRLKVRESGRLASDAISLRKAIQVRKDIAKEFGKYNQAAKIASDFSPVLKDLDGIFKDIGIESAITKSDSSIIKTLSGDSFNQMTALGDQYSSAVSNKIYSAVLVGDDVEDLTLEVRQLLIGGTDKGGRPMSAHAKTIATTGYREADSAILDRKAEEFGIVEFEYAGSLIKDSRKWCIDHVNRTYTREEIRAWEGQTWKGKKSGDPFITRGGWNCRHRWLPIAPK